LNDLADESKQLNYEHDARHMVKRVIEVKRMCLVNPGYRLPRRLPDS